MAALAAIGSFAATAPASAESGGVGFRVDGSPQSTMTAGFIKLAVVSGGSSQAYFYATNTSSRTAKITLFPADGITGVTTGIVYGDIADTPRRAGAWITPDTGSFTLEPRTERRVNFTVSVPPGTPTGDHIGGVVMQQVNPASNGQVKQIVRNVIPVHVEVPGGNGNDIEIRDATISNLPGTNLPAVDVGLRNAGKLMCRPTLAVTLKGPSENNVRVSRQLDVLLPGDRINFPLPWPTPLASGSYLVRINVTGCGTPQAGSFTALTPDDPNATPPPGGSRTPKPVVVTDAQPSLPAYTPGSRLTGGRDGGGAGSSNGDGGAGDGDGSDGDGAGAAPPKKPPPAGLGTIGNGKDLAGGSLLGRAAQAALEAGPDVAKRASILLLLLAAIGFLFFIQEAFDRRDPKLALAPVQRDPDLPFDSDPLATRQVEPSPSRAAEAT